MRWILWVCRAAATAVFISALSVFTAWYAVNRQVEGLLKQYSLVPPESSFNLQDYLTELSRQAAPFLPVIAGLGQSGADVAERSELPLSQPTPSPGKEGDMSAPADALSVWGRVRPDDGNAGTPGSETDVAAGSGETGSPGNETGEQAGGPDRSGSDVRSRNEEVAVTTERFQEMRDRLNEQDKARIFSLLASRLPEEEIQRLTTFVDGGITRQELEQIDKLVESRLTPAEYEELKQILEKY